MSIVDFALDPERLAVIAECMEHYGVGEPTAQRPNNIISRDAVVYASGAIARRGEVVRHEVDPDELELVRDLARRAAEKLASIEVGMGSEGGPDPWHPFYVAANTRAERVTEIDEALIRARFGGTIFPPATVRVEPIGVTGQFWSEFSDYWRESEPSVRDPILATMREAMRWFEAEPAFTHRAFVMIGEAEQLWSVPQSAYPPGTEVTGCVLPRMILGLTEAGSLAGVFGHTVQT